ncbi:hypothetical protein [Desulfosediminicola sp.]|uniref:hypothetical protein n=1 Tax=Desulfosediminicola sp. TaxID=2886825 RepID=UPI003AF23D73
MKKMASILLFIGFMVLCGWEVVPKFYETATQENAVPLFVASTKKNHTKEQTKLSTKEVQEIDYKELTKGINTDGA